MHAHRLAPSLFVVVLALGLAPVTVRAQAVVREPCAGRWDDCVRRDDIDRRLERARMRSFDRADQAELRAQRLADARVAREERAQARAESRTMDRAFAAREQSEARAIQREDRAMDRREQAAVSRRLRIRPFAMRW